MDVAFKYRAKNPSTRRYRGDHGKGLRLKPRSTHHWRIVVDDGLTLVVPGVPGVPGLPGVPGVKVGMMKLSGVLLAKV